MTKAVVKISLIFKKIHDFFDTRTHTVPYVVQEFREKNPKQYEKAILAYQGLLPDEELETYGGLIVDAGEQVKIEL